MVNEQQLKYATKKNIEGRFLYMETHWKTIIQSSHLKQKPHLKLLTRLIREVW